MGYSATITKSGQITIPKWVREALNVTTGQRVIFRRNKDSIVIERAKTVDELTDKIHSLIPADIREAYIKEYGGLTAAEFQEKWLESDDAKEYFAEELRRSL
ncbi:AbrB/MazE/SpoVT family DNA-binding domain-containing protein [Candidatus Saccharibacteria bacterium]|nr:AbrB/MazE/SpoVT family DNA-binding domain-containing protein [Candidatus Saccharibacteria bacterium]